MKDWLPYDIVRFKIELGVEEKFKVKNATKQTQHGDTPVQRIAIAKQSFCCVIAYSGIRTHTPSRAESDSARLSSTRLLCTLILGIRHNDFLEVGTKTAIHNNGLFCFFLIISASLSINIVSVSANGVNLSPIPSVGLCVRVCRSVCPESVLWQNG